MSPQSSPVSPEKEGPGQTGWAASLLGVEQQLGQVSARAVGPQFTEAAAESMGQSVREHASESVLVWLALWLARDAVPWRVCGLRGAPAGVQSKAARASPAAAPGMPAGGAAPWSPNVEVCLPVWMRWLLSPREPRGSQAGSWLLGPGGHQSSRPACELC